MCFSTSYEKGIVNYTETNALVKYQPLSSRDAFDGGRRESERKGTNGIYKFYVNKYLKYRLGYPNIYIGGKCYQLNLENLENQCLFHQVVLTRTNGKLMFVVWGAEKVLTMKFAYMTILNIV